MAIQKGDTVSVEYEGRLDDGTVFDASSQHGKPLVFEVGAGEVIPGFDQAFLGLSEGEEKEIVISPAEGYGEYNPHLLKKIPRDRLPPSPVPRKGMMLAVGTPDGKKIPGVVKEVHSHDVTVDLNHPLAGKTLTFKVKVVGIN